MKLLFLIYLLPLGEAFLKSSQNGTCILMQKHKKTNLFYIVCNMGFETKHRGLFF
jgi:hypothetical protein